MNQNPALSLFLSPSLSLSLPLVHFSDFGVRVLPVRSPHVRPTQPRACFSFSTKKKKEVVLAQPVVDC